MRRSRRRPLLSVSILLVLALSLGAAGATTSLVHAVLLNELPFPAGDRVAAINETLGDRIRNVSYRSLTYWRERQSAFEEIAAVNLLAEFEIESGEYPERASGAAVTCEYFRVLGARPVRGGGLLPEDCGAGGRDVVVLSHGLWQRRFGGSESIIGQTVRVNGQLREVAGVMPPLPRVELLGWSELWTPIRFDRQPELREPRTRRLAVIGKLKPGVTAAGAERELAALQRDLARDFPESHADCGAMVRPARVMIAGAARTSLLFLWGAVVCVFLMAAVGIGSLLLADGVKREREFGLRAALGAGRGRLARQLLSECLVLAVIGAALAAPLAAWTLHTLRDAAGVPVPRLAELSWLNWPFLISLAAGAGVTALLGTLPVLLFAKADPQTCMRTTTRGTTGNRGKQRAMAVLVAAKIALATVLVHGFGLMLASLQKIERVPAGFEVDGLAFLDYHLPPARYGNYERKAAFLQRATEALRETPGIAAVGVTASVLPLGGPQAGWMVFPEGHPEPEPGNEEFSHTKNVTGAYFEAMGIPIVRGRAFSGAEDWTPRRVVVVNETLAKKFWPGADAVGKRVKPNRNAEWEEIVGVAGDTRQSGLRDDPLPEVYRPYSQYAEYPELGRHVTFAIRTWTVPETMLPALQAALRGVDPALPPPEFRLARQLLDDGRSRETLLARLLAVFGGLGILIAVVGIAGVTGLMVAERRREIGVRMALGATPGSVVASVIRYGGVLMVAGVAAGLVIGLLAARGLEGFFYGVEAGNPWMLAATTVTLGLAALLACIAPALAAVRVDPARALQAE